MSHSQLPKQFLQLLQQSEQEKLRGNHEEAIALAQEVLNKDPECIEALEEIADNYLALNDFDKARNAAEFAIELSNTSYTALYILGFIESLQGHFPVAIPYLEQANDLKANNPEILRALGWAYFMDNKRLKGIVILERALNLKQDDVMTLCDLGICYIKNNNPSKALDLFYQAMQISPDDKRVLECIKLAEEMNTQS